MVGIMQQIAEDSNGYAPDPNPLEHVWKHTKYDDLANYVPDDLLDLELECEMSIDQTQQRPELSRSFMRLNWNPEFLHLQDEGQ